MLSYRKRKELQPFLQNEENENEKSFVQRLYLLNIGRMRSRRNQLDLQPVRHRPTGASPIRNDYFNAPG